MILTFYSYKGGVGRTQLLTNVASYLCYYRGKKVLLLEWDLEAPGLHFFFGKKDLQKQGLLDVLNGYVKEMRSQSNPSLDDMPYFDESYITNVIQPEDGTGKVDMITASVYDESYTKRANAFNWDEFYNFLDGKVYIEFLKKKLKELDYDYIFIDSRTGIGDYSGICNIQMPEMNVMVMAPTDQNFEGCMRVIRSIQQSPYIQQGFRKALIMPILSRLDRNDNEESGKWFKQFKDKFKEVAKTFIHERNLNTSFGEYCENTLLDYKRSISYGENILFHEDKREIVALTLEKQYETIGNYLDPIEEKQIIDFDLETIREKAISLISKSEIEQSINTLVELPGFQDDPILTSLRWRYQQLQSDWRSQIISLDQYSKEDILIIATLFEYLKFPLEIKKGNKDLVNSESEDQTLLKQLKSEKQDITNLVDKGQFQDAMDLLIKMNWRNHRSKNELIIISGEERALFYQQISNMIPEKDHQRQYAKLAHRLVRILEGVIFDLEIDINGS